MNTLEKTSCPLCKADDAVPVRTRADIVKCCQCDLVYLRTRSAQSELEAQYQTYHTNPGTHMRLPDSLRELRSTGLRREDMMSEILAFTGPERGVLMDIGSGYGAFLLNARDKGFAVFGCEVCSGMADYATKNLGIVTVTHLKDQPFTDGAFQVVTMFHSLEHMPDQSEMLGWIHRMLSPGGFFCGIVPNFNSYASNNQRDAWEWLDPVMHVVQYTPATLQKALWQFGFATLKMYTTTGDFDRKLLPTGAQLAKIERDGNGEEIHWVAQKL